MVLQSDSYLTMVSTKARKEFENVQTKSTNSMDGPCCWICLDNKPDDDWNPVVRKCACCGDHSGYSHLSCLIQYAEKKNIQDERKAEKRGQPLDVDTLIQPWTECPNCKQPYQGHVRLALASFLYEAVQYLPECNLAFIHTLHSMAQALMTNSKYSEAKEHLERAVRIVKDDLNQEHTDVRRAQTMALAVFSDMADLLAYKLGDLNGAIPYKKSCVKLRKGLYGKQHVSTKKEQQGLSFLKSLLVEVKDRTPFSSLSSQQPEQYSSLTLKQSEYDDENSIHLPEEDDWETISFKGAFGEYRCIQGDTMEGLKLTEEAFRSCLRVFGPDHPITAELAHMHFRQKSIHGPKIATVIGTKKRNGTKVTILKLRPNGTYLVKLHNEDGPIKVFKSKIENLMLHAGTYIRLSDGKQGMVQSFDAASQLYTMNVKGLGVTQNVMAKDCTIIFS